MDINVVLTLPCSSPCIFFTENHYGRYTKNDFNVHENVHGYAQLAVVLGIALARGRAPERSAAYLLAPVFAMAAWATRDQWLAAWGLQSPGRWLAGQRVVALPGEAPSRSPAAEM